MSIQRDIRRRAPAIAVPLLGCLILSYFAFDILEGERGLPAIRHLTQEVGRAELTLALIRDERRQLERRVDLLRPTNLDRDLLDERARLTLGLRHPDELVVDLTAPPAGATPQPGAGGGLRDAAARSTASR